MKIKVAKLSVLSNLFLVLLKLIVGLLMHSVSVLSEALHSGLDLLASLVAFFAVKTADKPADEIHEFGHGKFENLSAVIEALLIFIAAALIINNSISKIIRKDFKLEFLGWGIIVMIISSTMNFFISQKLFKTAKKTNSLALEADGLHLLTDVYTALGVAIGLVIIKITKFNILDPIFALIIAIIIIKSAYILTYKSVGGLLDTKLTTEEENTIKNIIQGHQQLYVNFHKLRTRKSGAQQHIDLHLVLNKNLLLENAHNFSTHLENDIKKEFPNANVLIHIEPDKKAIAN